MRDSHVGSLIKPRRLSPGGTIGVVAPAGPVDPTDLHRGVEQLERIGFKVILGRHIEKRDRFFAGRDAERAEDLQGMFENSEIDAVVCARGGSGSARLLRHLDPTRLAHHPKIFVGCSDITTLLLYFSRSLGWVTFHGPMVAPQFGKDPSRLREENFLRVLGGETVGMTFPAVRTLRPGTGEGVLTGGCLTLICTTIGTPYEIETDGKVLFIEETDEAPYRIDRMLSYLKSLGKFDRLRGVVVGQMPRCQPESVPEIILEIFDKSSGPILFNFPSGHGESIATLPFGTPVRIDGTIASLRMEEPAVV
ncbi:MAG: LD-carboxypeptidase [Candidatus Manganitrophaceae bacterium]